MSDVREPQPSLAARRGERAPAPAMGAFDRLLVPIDFSAASRAAFRLAMRIAERWGSEVILFHAAGLGSADEFLEHTGVRWGRADIVGEARDHLHRFADTVVPGSGERVRVDATRDDDAVRAVVGALRRHGASCVVLGTDPRDRPRVLRSRAERMMRALECPIVLAPAEREPPLR